jgi:hypothetical protein
MCVWWQIHTHRMYCLKTRRDETAMGCIIKEIEVTQDRVCRQVVVITVMTWVSWTVVDIFLTSCVFIFSQQGFHSMKLIGWNSLLLWYDACEKCCFFYKYLCWSSYFIALVACTSVLIYFEYLCWPSYDGQYESKSLLFFPSKTLIMITFTMKSAYVMGDIDNRVHITSAHSLLHHQYTFSTFVWDSDCCLHKTLCCSVAAVLQLIIVCKMAPSEYIR